MKLPTYQSPKEMFQKLATVWYPESNLTPGAATGLADSYSELMRQLGSNPDLAFLDAELVGPTSGAAPAPPTAAAERKAFFFVLDLIQLMENIWFEFKLESDVN